MLYVCGRGSPRAILFQFFILAMGLGLFVSCGRLPDYQVLTKQDAFVADASLNPNIDLLFVVDNSQSMEADQAALASSLDSFITQFTNKNLQYHIGVITTDTCAKDGLSSYCSPTNKNWWRYDVQSPPKRYTGIINDGPGSLLSKYAGLTFLTWNMVPGDAVASKAATVTKFVNNVNLNVSTSTFGSGSEAPLSTLAEAFSPTLQTGWNANFLRSGSFLSVIIITDEDESYGYAGSPAPPCPGDPTTCSQNYISDSTTDQDTRIAAFKTAMENTRGTRLDNFSLNVIAVPAGALTCASDPVNYAPALTLDKAVTNINTNYPPLGTGLQKATFTNVCNDFSGALVNIASDIIQANARYKLVQPPVDPMGITVFVNGVAVPKNNVNGWDYYLDTTTSPNGHYVEFFGTSVPNAGDSISIDYIPGAPT